MAIYIVRSRRLRASAALSMPSTRLTAARRKTQVDALLECRLQDPADQELRSWLTASQATVVRVTPGESHTPVTGTTLIDTSEAEAARLVRDVGGLVVLRDQPMHLIQPTRRGLAKKKLAAADLWHQKAIALDAARHAGFKGTGQGVTVAVLDTGIDDSHKEIKGKVDASYEFDVANWQYTSIASKDTDGHGTHVAGLIAGKKVGVAPGARLQNGIMIPGGSGNLSDFLLALEWASAQPEISIVNMSAGIPGFVAGMETVIEDLLAAGVLPVIATGNEGRGRTRSPGNYDPVLSVGASNSSSRVATFSSSGSMSVDNHMFTVPELVAPGENVTSCVMGGGYEAWDGTSMATPIVAGVAALMLERWPEISILDLIEELLGHCKDLGAPESRQGAGLVQISPRLRPARAKKKKAARKRNARPKKKARKKKARPRKKARKKTPARKRGRRKSRGR